MFLDLRISICWAIVLNGLSSRVSIKASKKGKGRHLPTATLPSLRLT